LYVVEEGFIWRQRGGLGVWVGVDGLYDHDVSDVEGFVDEGAVGCELAAEFDLIEGLGGVDTCALLPAHELDHLPCEQFVVRLEVEAPDEGEDCLDELTGLGVGFLVAA
jgi:hypothetical protein